MTVKPKRTPVEWKRVCETVSAGPVGGGLDPSRLYTNAGLLYDILKPLNLWKAGDRILDVGSGNGRLAMALCDKEDVEYVGAEIIADCVDFCKAAFVPYKNFSFVHLDVINPRYWSIGSIAAEEVVFPAADSSIDLVIMLSVMTHITFEAAKRNAAEAYRVLKPGGLFFSTWFSSPPNTVSLDPARTVFKDYHIIEALHKFRTIASQGGTTTEPHDQWYITSKKPL